LEIKNISSWSYFLKIKPKATTTTTTTMIGANDMGERMTRMTMTHGKKERRNYLRTNKENIFLFFFFRNK
jgi:hypothetical protein